ncbi:MAG: dihydroorotate dehydrogenase electron transfer subunit [Acidobacteriota bacterium]|nr:dihydroorotate dehydrogenase electron transfer subunit [Acidobacteriota bacterium]
MSAFGKIIDAVVPVERNEIVRSGSSRSYGYLRLRLDEPIPVLPGQFAMLKAHGIHEPLLRRAMAFYRQERMGEKLDVEFIYQILGRGTQELAKLAPGDKVDFLGSLGNTYDINFTAGREALLVAGGVGSPAVFMLAEELLRRDIPTRLFLGGASHGDLCGLNDFTALLGKENIACATVDGSYGEQGVVTAPLERQLKALAGKPAVIYSCGPDPMLHAVAKLADAYEVPAQLSLEAPMGCGFGVCVGCAVAVKHDCPANSSESFVYKKVCTDGPVFWSKELHW